MKLSDEIINSLSINLRKKINNIKDSSANIEEIRLRVNKPMIINGDSQDYFYDNRNNCLSLNIKNPYINEIGQEDLLDNYKAYRNGHDGAFLLSGMHFLVKTKGNQIKSATDNIGAFSRTDDNIYHANTNLITNTEIYANPIANGATDNAYGVRLVNVMDSFVR